MKTVLFIQPSFQPPGGGNGLAAWMVQALLRDHRVTVCTWQPFDAAGVGRFWGTSLASADIEVREVPGWVRLLVEAIPLPASLLRTTLLMRFARRLVHEYDIVASANNETDFGRPGIQYVHYPARLRPRPRVDMRWYHSLPGALPLYYWMCDHLLDVSSGAANRNLTLVNSDWTGEHYRRRHGSSPQTLYPPVAGTFADVPWATRANAFVCVGRLAPEKDHDTVIDVVAAVRAVHPDVHLHIVGSPGERTYYRRIVARIQAHADWITLHLDMPPAALRQLLVNCRYGLHGMENEHFGMAPAEMVTAGCIAWVRDDGGQVEIVGGDRRLIYRTREQAVASILAVMASDAEQAALRTMLAERAPQFALDRFMDGVRAATEQLNRQVRSADETSARNSG